MSQAIAAGRAMWEGRSDASLLDYLDGELTSEYKHLQQLLVKLLKGGRDESGQVDAAKGAEQVAALHKECDKGMFSDFKEQVSPTPNRARTRALTRSPEPKSGPQTPDPR